MNVFKIETYYIEYRIIPTKGVVQLKHHFSQSLSDAFDISALMQFAILPTNIRHKLPWTSGAAKTKIRLICWKAAGPLRRDLAFKSIY